MGLILLLILLLFTKYMLGVISSEFDSKKIVTLILGIIPILFCIIVVLFCKNEGVLYFLGKYSGLMFLVHTFFTEFFKSLIYFPKWVILSCLLLLLLSLMTSVVIDFLIKLGRKVFIEYQYSVALIQKYVKALLKGSTQIYLRGK